jgi:Tol biopolymer transport system component
MITKSGTKLLDFGLAKLKKDTAPGNVTLSKIPTEDAVTAQGTILGTLQYMAPEQLEGKEADARTDIFAFGVVVYEMATGKKCFEGKSQASLIAKILETDPPSMVSLQPMTPPTLDRVVKKCLAKEPERRWQAASDVCDELKWIAQESATRASPEAALLAARTKSSLKIMLSAGAAVALSIVVGVAVSMFKPTVLKSVTRFTISLPLGQRLDIIGAAIAISPDGTRLVYAAGSSNLNRQLYVRAMDGLESRPIPGTEGAAWPFFSPDGQWVGFGAAGRLMKVALNGAPPVALLDTSVGGFFGASWGSQGKIAVAGQPAGGGIRQIPDTGGEPQPLTRLESGEVEHHWPEFLPAGRGLLFMASLGGNTTKIVAQSLGAGERREVLQTGSFPRYALSGHLIYQQGAVLMAAPFDPARLAINGAAVPVVDGVLQSPGAVDPHFSFSSTGSLVYVPGSVRASQLKLVWVDRKGTEQPIAAPAHDYVLPKVSPDGQHVAAGIEEGDSQIWVDDLGRDTLTRLTFEGGANIDPVWTPDGKRIVFKGAQNRLFWQPADGSAGAEALTSNALSGNNVPGSWTPDGQVLTFLEINPNTGYDVYTMSLKDRTPRPFVQTRALETAPRFSPDGHFIAYNSDESGRAEVYVRPYPGPGGKWQISTEGGTEPVWNPRGRELFYRSGNKMMAVEVATQASFSAGKPNMLFEGPYVTTPRSFPDYDVSPDGQRFLMLKASDQSQAPAQINVVLNWFEELKQKVPTGKK